MDHSPHYICKSYEEYKSYVEKNSTYTAEELAAYTKAQWESPEAIDTEEEQKLIALALKQGISIATHDDNSPQRVDKYRCQGSTVSEFPLNEETASHVINHRMFAVVGAPNLFRNNSHANNISARHAITNRLANIVCSDYYCFALLASVFILFEEGLSLEEAVAYVTLYPAKSVGMADNIGSLEEGKEADIILVRYMPGELPIVERAMVAGRLNLGIH